MDQYLTIIQYESAADQTFLVMNNEQILGYFEDPETGVNAMIGVMTKDQYEHLLSKGYYIQIVEKSPVLTNFVLYENTLPNQAELLAKLGRVYALTKNHTLVRKTEPTIMYDISSTFTEIPLVNMKDQIAQNNNVDLSEPIMQNKNELKVGPPPISYPNSKLEYILNPGIIFIVLSLLCIIGFIVRKRFKKTPPQTINDPPVMPIN